MKIFESAKATELYQALLAEVGLYKGKLDGLPGPQTKAADSALLAMTGKAVNDDGRLLAILGKAHRMGQFTSDLLTMMGEEDPDG